MPDYSTLLLNRVKLSCRPHLLAGLCTETADGRPSLYFSPLAAKIPGPFLGHPLVRLGMPM
jgi:hypothetical protein